jgi:glycosyltransferase involved in cell wall biosynthesis
MNDGVRVLQVITDTDRRGAQVFAVDLGDALAALGCVVTTVAVRKGTTSSLLDVAQLGRYGRSPAALIRLRRRMGEADVTIAHGSSTLLACRVAGAGGRRPWIYRQISDPLFWAGTRSRSWRVGRLLAKAAAVTALSPQTAEVLAEHFGVATSKLTVIPNGVSAARFRPPAVNERDAARRTLQLDDDQFVALYVGALAVEKGVAVAVRAVASAAPAVTLLVAGDGPQRDELRLLAERDAPGRVRFLASVADVVPLYHAADVVVFPSIGGDSMPAALIESGLCGLPAICTPIGAATDVVVDGTTGRVVPANDVGALVTALQAIGKDGDRRRAMGLAAVEYCRSNFEIQPVATRWLAVLDRIVDRNGSRTA